MFNGGLDASGNGSGVSIEKEAQRRYLELVARKNSQNNKGLLALPTRSELERKRGRKDREACETDEAACGGHREVRSQCCLKLFAVNAAGEWMC
jgi:hypothetical protein